MNMKITPGAVNVYDPNKAVYWTQEDGKREAWGSAVFQDYLTSKMPQHKWEVRRTESPDSRAHSACIDCDIYRDGKRVALLELRGRNGSSHSYRTWHTSRAKLDRCQARARRENLMLFIAIPWGKEMFYINGFSAAANNPQMVQVGGRTDRNDPRDVEAMQHIPREAFTHIPTKEFPNKPSWM
jgi:hypothetical protein